MRILLDTNVGIWAAAEPERFRVIQTNREAAAVAADVWEAVAHRFADALDEK